MTLNHNIDRALQRLILQSVAQLAFPIRSGRRAVRDPALLAGTTAAGVNAIQPYERFMALSGASGEYRRP